MKAKKSAWMLVAHSTVYKVAAVLFVTIAVQTGLYWWVIRQHGGVAPSLEYMIEHSGVQLVSAAGFIIMAAILCLTGCEFSTRVRYTLMRLRVPEEQFFYAQCVFNIMYLIMFWAGQIAGIFICCAIYRCTAGEGAAAGQQVFFVFYCNEFWHSLLPMADIVRVFRNIIFVAAFGIASASVPVYQRQRKVPVWMIIVLSCVMIFFTGPMDTGNKDLITAAVAAVGGVISLSGSRACMREETI